MNQSLIKEITIFIEKFAQNSMNLSEEKIVLLKNSLDIKYRSILNDYYPYLKHRIDFYKNNFNKQQKVEIKFEDSSNKSIKNIHIKSHTIAFLI